LFFRFEAGGKFDQHLHHGTHGKALRMGGIHDDESRQGSILFFFWQDLGANTHTFFFYSFVIRIAALGHSETMRTSMGANRGYMVDDALCTYLSACIYAPVTYCPTQPILGLRIEHFHGHVERFE
jgi:hypothetical protein